MKPLSGIRVLDLSQYLPGPLCCQMLADFGAEVIKIESISGELGRIAEPLIGGNWAHYYNVNRNKKSLAIDLKTEMGKEIFKNLIKKTDVVVEQFRPGVMDKLGLGYEELKKMNKRLIYCALTGYGHSGPLKMAAGHDNNYLSITGIISVSGTEQSPALSGTQVADIAGGSLHSVIAVLLALRARETTGEGQFCDVGMVDGCATMLAYLLADYWGSDTIPERRSNMLNGGLAYYNIYETADGKFVSLGALELKFWASFCMRVGREEWINGHNNLNPGVQKNLINELSALFKQKNQKEWLEYTADLDICLTPVLELDEVVQHPQILARDLVVKVENFRDSGKTALFPGIPIKLSATPGEVILEFADLGEHSRLILEQAGYSTESIERFLAEGIIK